VLRPDLDQLLADRLEQTATKGGARTGILWFG